MQRAVCAVQLALCSVCVWCSLRGEVCVCAAWWIMLSEAVGCAECCWQRLKADLLNTHLGRVRLSMAATQKLVRHTLAAKPRFLAIAGLECRALAEPHVSGGTPLLLMAEWRCWQGIQAQVMLCCNTTQTEQLLRRALLRAAECYSWPPTHSAVFGANSPAADAALGGGWVAALLQLLAACRTGLSYSEASLALTRLGYRERSLVCICSMLNVY